ncbi:MAG: insulinase family protein [Chloroflexi bacterium]|nr:insulinase family protein [Chloroflexota bacterium]
MHSECSGEAVRAWAERHSGRASDGQPAEPADLSDYGIQRTTLGNGIAVLSRHVPDPDIVAICIGVRAGARFEDDVTAGVTKFLEKLYLQGTERRPGPDLVQRPITVRGGSLSTLAGSELVLLQAQVRSADLDVMLDVLSDVVLHSTFTPERIENEARVILEELNARRANPNVLAADLFFKTVFAGHPLARLAAGDLENTPRLTRDTIVGYRNRYAVGHNTVIAVAGNLPTDRAFAHIETMFGAMPAGEAAPPSNVPPPAARHERVAEKAGSAQARVILGGPLPGLRNDVRFPLSVANAILGGSGFRLFREIRDLRGLSYDPSPGMSQFPDAGIWLTSAGTDPVNVETVADLLTREVRRLSEEPISAGDLENAKNYLEGSLVLGLETPAAQAGQMVRDEVFGSPVLSAAHRLGIRRVTADDVLEAARTYLRPEDGTLVVVQP